MSSVFDFEQPPDLAWCPGCGNYDIIKSVKAALDELDIPRERIVMVSGIGQAAKLPQYINASFFNGLHGRSLPAATAIKATNPELTVIVESGDGCTYGEGGNHFLAALRRNPDITNLVHDNMVYGLTKGQASPTSRRGFRTPVQITGVFLEPFNPVAVAVSMNASFVARAFSGDVEKTKEIIKHAIMHKGYSLVDILHPCVSFNKANNFSWYRNNTYYLDDNHDPSDKGAALERSLETDKLPLGVIYINSGNKTFEENLSAYKNSVIPLYVRKLDAEKLMRVIEARRY
ncbi:MAG TPA: thiamine pyrophosphate-dependent enzyme [Spirochaetota bacterium]|mgnify:CR=1 FL=1|nr:2-oxoacid ferredoxin oxidoreductase [Spirochaetota bacterium]HPG50935.1 thiamine pyrophosphate-dependent enzyme [Spirochaetota bacterium]HPN12617.1 thiamine pyrophosphate-dependent enzyme [Spirochaetota bacterium]